MSDIEKIIKTVMQIEDSQPGHYTATLIAERDALRVERDEAREEIILADALLTERNRVLSAIPECEAHGSQCIPHALEWIAKQTAANLELDALRAENARLQPQVCCGDWQNCRKACAPRADYWKAATAPASAPAQGESASVAQPEAPAPAPDKRVCHAPGDRCMGCDHYKGLAPSCKFAPAPAQLTAADVRAEFAARENAAIAKHFGAAQPVAQARLTDAARDVLAERERQTTAEGWTPEHDDKHNNFSLCRAAAAYCISASGAWRGSGITSMRAPMYWPWSAKWWKPSSPRRDLVKAAALCLSEIERLDRASALIGGAK